MTLMVKRLDPNAVIPFYAHPGDAGLDLTALSVLYKDNYIEIGTGIAIELPENHVGFLLPRSSISNTGLSLCNSLGTIDNGYRGELKLRFYVVSPGNQYKVGDRVAQLFIVPFKSHTVSVISDLTETERSASGFGSTGN